MCPCPRNCAWKSLYNLQTLKLPFPPLHAQMKGSFQICLERKFIDGSKRVLYQKVGIFWVDMEVLRKFGCQRQEHLQIMCTGFWPHFHWRKCSHKAQPSPLKFFFLHLISYAEIISLKEMDKDCCCRVKSTRLDFKVRRLHKDFLVRLVLCLPRKTALENHYYERG